MCERRYRVREQWYNLRSDALAEYRVGQQQMRFWLEWDCGTMNVRDLEVTFTSYASYIASREWARECSMLPVLVCVAPDIAQERRVQRVAQARLTSYSWGSVVGNHRGAVERARAACIYLVAGYSTTQSSGTAGRFAQTILVRSVSLKELKCM